MTTPKNITFTSTPKENFTLPSEKRKSTLVPDKNLSANLFTHKNNSRERLNDIDDESDSYSQVAMITDRNKKQKVQQNHIHFGFGNNIENTYNPVVPNVRNNHIATSSFNENQSTRITEANFDRLLKNMENKFNRMSENLQRKHKAELNEAYDQIQQTIIEFNAQQNQRNAINTQNRRTTEINDQRQQQSENNEIQNNSITEPPLPFYKQLTSMSINEKPQIERLSSNGSVPTTIKPFDGTDPGYTVEEYLNSIIAAMIFSNGIEPVNKLGHQQWKVKRAALILHTLQGPAQKWYSTLPSETKLDWELFCKKFSDMFDSEKSKQPAKIVLQKNQKHTNESLRSLALRIETLVKIAYSLYTEDYKNSIMNQIFIRCLDNELKTAALKKHTNHKPTPREPEIPFKTLLEKIDQMDLTRTITNNHKRLYEVNQSTSNQQIDNNQISDICSITDNLNQNNLDQFEDAVCNVVNGINNTYDRKNFKGRPKFA